MRAGGSLRLAESRKYVIRSPAKTTLDNRTNPRILGHHTGLNDFSLFAAVDGVSCKQGTHPEQTQKRI